MKCFVDIILSHEVFSVTEQLATALQSKKTTLSDAITNAMTVVSTLKEMWSEESCRRTWLNICQSLVSFTCLHRGYHESENHLEDLTTVIHLTNVWTVLPVTAMKPGLPFSTLLSTKSTNGFLRSVLSLSQTSKMCCCGLLMECQ